MDDATRWRLALAGVTRLLRERQLAAPEELEETAGFPAGTVTAIESAERELALWEALELERALAVERGALTEIAEPLVRAMAIVAQEDEDPGTAWDRWREMVEVAGGRFMALEQALAERSLELPAELLDRHRDHQKELARHREAHLELMRSLAEIWAGLATRTEEE